MKTDSGLFPEILRGLVEAPSGNIPAASVKLLNDAIGSTGRLTEDAIQIVEGDPTLLKEVVARAFAKAPGKFSGLKGAAIAASLEKLSKFLVLAPVIIEPLVTLKSIYDEHKFEGEQKRFVEAVDKRFQDHLGRLK